jgi:hypothetical protein
VTTAAFLAIMGPTDSGGGQDGVEGKGLRVLASVGLTKHKAVLTEKTVHIPSAGTRCQQARLCTHQSRRRREVYYWFSSVAAPRVKRRARADQSAISSIPFLAHGHTHVARFRLRGVATPRQLQAIVTCD